MEIHLCLQITSFDSFACRENWDLEISMTWTTLQNWVQVQQLMCYGPKGNSQAMAALSDILQCVRCVVAALQSRHMQSLCTSLMHVATSQSGINRHVTAGDLLTGCQELESCVGSAVLDGSETVQELSIQAGLKTLDGSEYLWAPGRIASLEAFFMCVNSLFMKLIKQSLGVGILSL